MLENGEVAYIISPRNWEMTLTTVATFVDPLPQLVKPLETHHT